MSAIDTNANPRCTETTTIDDSLSAAFEHARDVLRAPVKSHCASSAAPPVICCPPANRDNARLGTLRLINSIDETRRHLDALQAELVPAQVDLVRRRSQAARSLFPCGALPVELLHEVFSYAVGDAGNCLGITRLASVCEQWRDVVIATPSFFVQANWDEWPPSLLEKWCARANGRPLTIKLGDVASTRLLSHTEKEFRRVLQSTKARWECLEVQFGRIITISGQGIIANLLFNDELPSLRRLCVTVPRATSLTNARIISIQTSLPLLQHLDLDGVIVHALPPKRFLSLKLARISVNLSSSSSWSEWTRAIQPRSIITSLTLRNLRPGNLRGHTMLELPSLTELQLISSPSEASVTFLLRSISIPNAHSVTLDNILYCTNSNVPAALSQCAPNLTSLSIVEVDNRWLISGTRALCSLNNGELLLPHLEELFLIRKTVISPAVEIDINLGLEGKLREFVAARHIAKLTLPTKFVSDECEQELRGFVGHLAVIKDDPCKAETPRL